LIRITRNYTCWGNRACRGSWRRSYGWLDGCSCCGHDAGIQCWEGRVAVDLPSQGSGWACRWAVTRSVGRECDTRRSDGLPLFGEVVVVWLDWGWSSAVDLAVRIIDKTVIVGFLNPFVDDAPRPGANHIRSEDGSLIIEGSLTTNIAACFREKDGYAVVFSHGLEIAVPRCLVCSITAPLVRIEAEKINDLIRLVATSEIILQHGTQLGNISSRISNGNLSVFLGSHVGLQVSCGCLDVWSSRRSVSSVDDFVSDPEAPQVVVLLKDVHNIGKGEELVFSPGRACLLDGGIESIQIKPDVNSCVGESSHASVVA